MLLPSNKEQLLFSCFLFLFYFLRIKFNKKKKINFKPPLDGVSPRKTRESPETAPFRRVFIFRF